MARTVSYFLGSVDLILGSVSGVSSQMLIERMTLLPASVSPFRWCCFRGAFVRFSGRTLGFRFRHPAGVDPFLCDRLGHVSGLAGTVDGGFVDDLVRRVDTHRCHGRFVIAQTADGLVTQSVSLSSPTNLRMFCVKSVPA